MLIASSCISNCYFVVNYFLGSGTYTIHTKTWVSVSFGYVDVWDYDQQTTETSLFHMCGWLDLAAAASKCVVQQSETNFHRICKAQTPGNSLSIALSTGYSSMHTAGGAFDRRWLKARCTNGHTYLLTYLPDTWSVRCVLASGCTTGWLALHWSSRE